ncbi:lytic transglycosylase domain-containing protein [Ancylobacter terrae]|uniref:lytic transglycosylase domain-containing protein n=1 Tax=Ancylobacter sp. sgz301288 TaxID=3342077 RepID=UPI00385D8264
MTLKKIGCSAVAAGFISAFIATFASASPNNAPASRNTTGNTDTSSTIPALVEAEARANGVPVALARAVVRIESNWNPAMTGRAGEVGLMQIKHPTARGMGYAGTREALYEPATNIRWGMRYLAGAYRLAGGDTCGTVMRYQGGHGARRMSPAARVYCGKALALIGRPDAPVKVAAGATPVRVAAASVATAATATRSTTRSTWAVASTGSAPVVVATVADRAAPRAGRKPQAAPHRSAHIAPATLAANAAPARVPAFAAPARMAPARLAAN